MSCTRLYISSEFFFKKKVFKANVGFGWATRCWAFKRVHPNLTAHFVMTMIKRPFLHNFSPQVHNKIQLQILKTMKCYLGRNELKVPYEPEPERPETSKTNRIEMR